MDENVVHHLEFSDYDVLMFYDYNSLDTNFDFNSDGDFSAYLIEYDSMKTK